MAYASVPVLVLFLKISFVSEYRIFIPGTVKFLLVLTTGSIAGQINSIDSVSHTTGCHLCLPQGGSGHFKENAYGN